MTVDQRSQGDAPALPPGWENAREALIRIANPTSAVAANNVSRTRAA